jgi:hypothetical protein
LSLTNDWCWKQQKNLTYKKGLFFNCMYQNNSATILARKNWMCPGTWLFSMVCRLTMSTICYSPLMSLLSGLLTMLSAMFWSMKKRRERGKPSNIPDTITSTGKIFASSTIFSPPPPPPYHREKIILFSP